MCLSTAGDSRCCVPWPLCVLVVVKAANQAQTIATCRTKEKVTTTKRDLDSIAKGGKISSYTYNLASLSQIRKFAEAIKADHKNIDVLINNAGVFETQRSLSEDGYEMTWAINVLAPFLLTSLLKDVVTDRVVNVSSISAGSSIDFDNLQQVSLLPICSGRYITKCCRRRHVTISYLCIMLHIECPLAHALLDARMAFRAHAWTSAS